MNNEERYLEIFLHPIRQCKDYLPKFGLGGDSAGLSLTQFQSLYEADLFYHWIGLDNPLMYSAHRTAGGITSIYRQIGISCERLFRAILIDVTGYTDDAFATWSYTVQTSDKKRKSLSLDGRIELSQTRNKKILANTKKWMRGYCTILHANSPPENGVVFEIRQGYKSKDSKRQNADIDNATVAWANGYLPVFAVFSSQIDPDIVTRYKNNRCGILLGIDSKNTQESLYAFCRKILGYDLAAFFNRYSPEIKKEVQDTLRALLH